MINLVPITVYTTETPELQKAIALELNQKDPEHATASEILDGNKGSTESNERRITAICRQNNNKATLT